MKLKNHLNLSILALLLLGLVACGGNSGTEKEAKISPEVVNNPATANKTDENQQGMPVFTFEKDNHEFGEIIQGERVTYAFKFKNTGDAPLVISSASASCGCTVPEYTKTPVEPGEEGFINVTFDSAGKSGMTSKTVTLIANTVPNTKVLTISADIQVPKEPI
jgi:Protein of unknown function (DUF1573)